MTLVSVIKVQEVGMVGPCRAWRVTSMALQPLYL